MDKFYGHPFRGQAVLGGGTRALTDDDYVATDRVTDELCRRHFSATLVGTEMAFSWNCRERG